jgi:voltage-gated potassium channel
MTVHRRLTFTVLLFVGLIAAGVSGYMLIEGWSFFDALYQTVTTITTVGFREVHPLSRAGQAFTMLLIIGGVGGVFYTLTTAVTMAVEGELGEYFGRRRMSGRISGMRDHYLVCGFGRVGQEIAHELHTRKAPFVVVDNNPEVLPDLRELGYDFVPGNATQDEVLKEAGIHRAAGLLAAADADTDNTYIVLSARALNPTLFIVARASRQSLEAKMIQAGANRVILPYSIAGRHMAFTAIQPAMYDFMTTTFQSREGDLILAELTVTPSSGLADRSLGEVFGDRAGVTVLALRKQEGAIAAGPPRDAVLALHDQIIVLGPPDQLDAFATRTGATVPLGEQRKAGRIGGHRIRVIGLSRRDASH